VDILKKIWDDPVWSKVISAGILLLFSTIWFYFKSWWPFGRDKTQTSSVSNSSVSKIFIRENSARELQNHLHSYPPLQREAIIINSYIGRWVQWEGIVKNVSSFNVSGEKKFLVTVADDEYTLSTCSQLSLSIDWREKVENLRVDDFIIFEGKIDTILFGDVMLIDCNFEMGTQSNEGSGDQSEIESLE